jgi:hypothetical protein
MKINWSSNIIIKVDGKKRSYVLDSIAIGKNTLDSIILKIKSKDERAEAIIPLSRQECKRFAGELIQAL